MGEGRKETREKRWRREGGDEGEEWLVRQIRELVKMNLLLLQGVPDL